MAPNIKSEVKSENQGSWDEPRLKESMEHLDQLHLKACLFRQYFLRQSLG